MGLGVSTFSLSPSVCLSVCLSVSLSLSFSVSRVEWGGVEGVLQIHSKPPGFFSHGAGWGTMVNGVLLFVFLSEILKLNRQLGQALEWLASFFSVLLFNFMSHFDSTQKYFFFIPH